MIKLQRRTFDVAKRRDIIHDIQRYVAQQAYILFGPSVSGSAIENAPAATGAAMPLTVTVAAASSTVPVTVVGVMLR